MATRISTTADQLRHLPLWTLLLLGIGLSLCSRVIYHVGFNPLKRYPGPLWASISGIPLMLAFATGNVSWWIARLHEKYGEVVRISPTELSFINVAAWKDIYGPKKGHRPLPKDMSYYFDPANKVDDILIASDDHHTRMRRAFEPAFTAKGMREMEPTLIANADYLISRLQETVSKPDQDVVDLVEWFNWSAFDNMGCLMFGKDFGCVETANYHPWISLIFGSLQIIVYFNVVRRIPFLFSILQYLTPASIRQQRIDHFQFTTDRVNERLESTTARPDFLTYIESSKEKDHMTLDEIHGNCALILVAGSETIGTTLSGAIFYLLSTPEKYERLRTEICSAFYSSRDITFTSVSELPYLTAVLQETFRIYPPSPIGLPRITPKGGEFVCENWIPGGTGVSLNQWSAYHSEQNFVNPFQYVPERWMDSERPKEYENDVFDVVQPFSTGPRNCIGKRLAQNELRLLLAKLIWHFDLEFPDVKELDQRTWWRQKIFTVWKKLPLMVRLKVRHQEST